MRAFFWAKMYHGRQIFFAAGAHLGNDSHRVKSAVKGWSLAMEPNLSSLEAQPSPGASSNPEKRSWLPVGIAAALLLALVAVLLVLTGHKKPLAEVSNTPDPYASSLTLSNLAMSESSNLAGGKVTYVDGHIANTGNRTVTGVTVEVIFRDYAKKVAQRESMPLMLVRMREPYIDTETVAAAPLKPGTGQDFRLNFDQVSADWAGELPEVRILQVHSK
jgi:hypothetical protein